MTIEDRILTYLGQRPAVLRHLTESLGLSDEDALKVLGVLQEKGWVVDGFVAWYGEQKPLTIYTLTPPGRREVERRNEIADTSAEPHEVTREELIADLKRQGVAWSEQEFATNPGLRASHYWYYPSILAFSAITDR